MSYNIISVSNQKLIKIQNNMNIFLLAPKFMVKFAIKLNFDLKKTSASLIRLDRAN